jgi:NhaC family Na+:H+ antiporter
VGIIIPSKLFEKKYKEFQLDPSMLARTISDTGVIIAPLMPWNVNVIIFSQVIGLESMKYIVFSMLCILFPVVTIIYGLHKKIVYQS